jgi:hypothetical protein
MARFKSNEKDYDTENLPPQCNEQPRSIQFAELEIARLNGQLSVIKKAKILILQP